MFSMIYLQPIPALYSDSSPSSLPHYIYHTKTPSCSELYQCPLCLSLQVRLHRPAVLCSYHLLRFLAVQCSPYKCPLLCSVSLFIILQSFHSCCLVSPHLEGSIYPVHCLYPIFPVSYSLLFNTYFTLI